MGAPLFSSIVVCVTCLKFLLLPSYKSTDFEVHRNWLAITHSLPKDRWYYESNSEWTLDYPPLFAWFEYGLSQIAQFFDAKMLKVSNLNYDSQMTIFFQRLSVIVTDLLFAFSVKESCKLLTRSRRGQKVVNAWEDDQFILCMILLTNAGLLMVDHIHFQYNGFLFGLLLLSIVRMAQNKYCEAALWFSILLNMKHIFLYVAPAYFVYLLRNYCFCSNNRDGSVEWKSFSIVNSLKLGGIVISVFAVSFGPFVLKGHLQQVLSRLFPFKRGLSHAYWAPNFWALYNTADKAASVLSIKLGLASNITKASMTGGLVQEYNHVILPSIPPLVTMALTATAILPAIYLVWKRPNSYWEFIRCVVLCAFTSYMFGWHVHEKAILLVTIPLSLLAVSRKSEASMFLLLSTVGYYSLFPLLYEAAETPTKILIMILYCSYIFYSFSLLYRGNHRWTLPLLSVLETIYLTGLISVHLYATVIHPFFLAERYPFLPLMVISSYCAMGMLYSWVKLNRIAWTDKNRDFHEKLN